MQLYSICFGLAVGLVDTDVVMCISVAVNWLICCTCWLDGLWLYVVVYFVVAVAL